MRPVLFVASRDARLAGALSAFAQPSDRLPYRVEPVGYSSRDELFERLESNGIEALVDTMIILDLTDEQEPWDYGFESDAAHFGIAAELVLTYPEVYFIFVTSGPVSERWIASAKASHLFQLDSLLPIARCIERHANGFRPLFDATGARSRLKCHLAAGIRQLELNSRRTVPPALDYYERHSISRAAAACVAADEEHAFVHLNAYAAYKFGFRCWIAPTRSEFLRITEEIDLRVAIVDWDFRFPDEATTGRKGGDAPKADGVPVTDSVQARTALFERTNVSPIVVTGQPDTVEKQEPRPDWLSKAVLSPKPYGGLFDLRKQRTRNGALNALNCLDRVQSAPDSAPSTDQSGPGTRPAGRPGHSAPFKCIAIADRLLDRARRLAASGPVSTRSWVQAAVLASEAKEILSGLSRTLSYEALALQHEAELQAEISFFGTTMDFDIDTRLEKLHHEGLLISGVEPSEKVEKKTAEPFLSFILQTVNKLRLRLVERERVDASERCLRAFASYSSALEQCRRAPSGDTLTSVRPAAKLPAWWNQGPSTWRSGAGWYLDFVTAAGTSYWPLFWASFVWVCVFGAVDTVLLALHPPANEPAWRVPMLGIGHAAMTFLELQPGLGSVDQHLTGIGRGSAFFYHLVLFCELLVGYLHLGLLVSVLHRQLTRRAP